MVNLYNSMMMREKLILYLTRTLNIVIPFLFYGLGAYYGNYYYELYSNDGGAMSDMRLSDFCFCVMFLGLGLILWNLLLGILSSSILGMQSGSVCYEEGAGFVLSF